MSRAAQQWRGLLLAALVVGACSRPAAEEIRLLRLTDLPGDEVEPTFSPGGGEIAFTSGAAGARDVLVYHLASGRLTPVAATEVDEHDPSWAPDGRRIAYTEAGEDGSQTIQAASLEAGLPRLLSPPGRRAYRARWSPAGDLVAFTVVSPKRRVWITPPDGEPRPLTDAAADHIAYGWSPDGDSVVTVSFAAEAQDVWSWPVAGGAPRRLTDRTGEEWWPTWSPLGDRIAFYSTWDDAMTDVWFVDVATGELTRVTDLPIEDFRPSWSPDGEWLAFSSDRTSKSGLWIQRARPEAIARPVATGGRAGGTPAWSPDGSALAFSYLTSKARLYLVSVDGTGLRALTGDERNVSEAVASPDGRVVAFETDGTGSEADLALLDLASGEIGLLTAETTYNARPSWSPDGTAIAFERSPGGGPRTLEIAVMSPSGGRPRILTDTGYARGPIWCGDEIVYTVEHSATGSEADQLWAVPVHSGVGRQLTSSAAAKRATDCTPEGDVLFHEMIDGRWTVRSAKLTPEGLAAPRDHGPGEGGRWSPDGTEIALLAEEDGRWDLYVVAADGDRRRVTATPMRESWPDWVPGSDDLIFTANPGDRDIWLAELPDPLD